MSPSIRCLAILLLAWASCDRPETAQPGAVQVRVWKDGPRLAYEVRNTSTQPIWCFTLVPSAAQPGLVADEAYAVELRPGHVLARLVDRFPRSPGERTPFEGPLSDRSAAKLLAPGGVHHGTLALGERPLLRDIDEIPELRVCARTVSLEIAWAPRSKRLERPVIGRDASYAHVVGKPHYLARSAEISWSRCDPDDSQRP